VVPTATSRRRWLLAFILPGDLAPIRLLTPAGPAPGQHLEWPGDEPCQGTPDAERSPRHLLLAHNDGGCEAEIPQAPPPRPGGAGLGEHRAQAVTEEGAPRHAAWAAVVHHVLADRAGSVLDAELELHLQGDAVLGR